jgi:hypothetical protein
MKLYCAGHFKILEAGNLLYKYYIFLSAFPLVHNLICSYGLEYATFVVLVDCWWPTLPPS